MPIQSPQAYAARPFDEPQPTPPARKPPVLQQHDRKDFPSNSQYQKATNAANQQYERENQAYLADKSQYDKDIQDWRSRKAAWDAGQEQKSNQSQAGQKRLEDYLASPEGKSQKNWNAGMTTAPMMPAALLSTYINKGMRNPAAKIGYGLLEAGAGEGLRRLTQEQQPDPYTDPSGHYTNQMWQNLALSSGVGAALGSIRSALMKPKPPEGVTAPEPVPAPESPPIEPYKGNPRDVARYIAHDLGLTPASKESKADTIANALGQIKSGNATKEQMELVAQRARGIEPTTILERIAKSNKPLAALLGSLGLGAAAAVGSPGEAEAATTEPRATTKPPETSSDFSDLEREFGTGLPKGKAREILKGAADAGSYMVPGIGEARMAADALGSYNPSDEDLADAEYWQRGREEMAKPHEANGGALNPEHLREHERSLLDNPEEAIRRASWQFPYLATGSHMVNITGDPDTFFGGKTPEHQQIYENTLRANKAFYENAFKRLADKSPHSTPQQPIAPEAPTEEEAPIGRKHGGPVNRKVISIHEAFKRRLEGQERKIGALEKAHARKASPKLSERLEKEKDESKRIRAHLERVKAHA
jgi:hypothetical protein